MVTMPEGCRYMGGFGGILMSKRIETLQGMQQEHC
jgi:hypothetical protein